MVYRSCGALRSCVYKRLACRNVVNYDALATEDPHPQGVKLTEFVLGGIGWERDSTKVGDAVQSTTLLLCGKPVDDKPPDLTTCEDVSSLLELRSAAVDLLGDFDWLVELKKASGELEVKPFELA